MATSRFISLRWRMLALVFLILAIMVIAASWVARSTYLDMSLQQQAGQLQQAHLAWQKQQNLQQRELTAALVASQAALIAPPSVDALSKEANHHQLSVLMWQSSGQPLVVWPDENQWRAVWPRLSTALQAKGAGVFVVEGNLWSCALQASLIGCMRLDATLTATAAGEQVQASLWLQQAGLRHPIADSAAAISAQTLDSTSPTDTHALVQWREISVMASEMQAFWRGEIQSSDVVAQANQVVSKIVTVFVLISMASVLLVIGHSRGLIKPLLSLQRFARAVGRGESIKLHDTFRNDEIGQLYQQMFAMKHALTERFHHLQYQATHDSLTGLYNRFAASQKIESSLLTQPLFLLQFRIQSFKEINDSLGFASGDEILLQLARRLKEQSDAVLAARLDSIEFLIAFPEQPDDAQVRKILTGLAQNYTLVQSKLQLRLVAGCHLLQAGADMQNGLRELSIATQQAQRDGVLLVHFTPALDDAHNRQLAMIRDLPVTAATDEFFVLYQPVMRLKDGKCLGAEALIRWRHPRLGIVSPLEFIPVAEYAGCIHVITQWMVNTVSADLARWKRKGLDLKVGVNLSVHDVLDSDLPQRLHTTLEQHHVDAHQLVLEVREDVVMHMPERSIETLKQLHQQGSLLTLDNFGKGQSSLAFLKTLPLQQLKIDRHFITNLAKDMTDQLIVRTTIELAHAMGQIVIAEGVEDEATLLLLQQMKCDLVQGYYFAKPLPVNEFTQWVQARSQQAVPVGL